MRIRGYIIVVAVALVLFLEACSPAGGENRGHEFMPDMVHSTAYEANIYNYYYYNTWGTEEEYKAMVNPRKPVEGTVPRGFVDAHYEDSQEDRVKSLAQFTGQSSQNAIAYTPNGSVPYYYDDTEEERTRAMAEIIDNPFPITEAGLARGKELYNIYCGICHGEKGDGLGYLVREADPAKGITEGVYPAAPANFQQQEFYDASNGRYYHAIYYGKNVMGAHADKLSYEERWQVIHYIRSLQAKEQGLVYNEQENTFTNDIPGASLDLASEMEMEHDGGSHDSDSEGHGGEHHGDDGHGDGEGHH